MVREIGFWIPPDTPRQAALVVHFLNNAILNLFIQTHSVGYHKVLGKINFSPSDRNVDSVSIQFQRGSAMKWWLTLSMSGGRHGHL